MHCENWRIIQYRIERIWQIHKHCPKTFLDVTVSSNFLLTLKYDWGFEIYNELKKL